MNRLLKVLCVVLLATIYGCNSQTDNGTSKVSQGDKKLNEIKKPHKPERESALCKRVIDGDTFELEDGRKVRLIGIDTPETKHPKKGLEFFGKEATEATKKLIEGKEVQLEYDVQKTDKYGRVLAYVYVGDIFLNAWLVENGYARVSTYPPNVKYQQKFLELERNARQENKGLWGNGK